MNIHAFSWCLPMGLKNHQTVKHGDGKYVRDGVHINGMESFWAFGEARV